MGLNIYDDIMTSDCTLHTARRVPGSTSRWQVSWLPELRLDRDGAITAMMLADHTRDGDIHPGSELWPQAESWAAELGLTVPAFQAAAASRRRPGKTIQPGDPEAAG